MIFLEKRQSLILLRNTAMEVSHTNRVRKVTQYKLCCAIVSLDDSLFDFRTELEELFLRQGTITHVRVPQLMTLEGNQCPLLSVNGCIVLELKRGRVPKIGMKRNRRRIRKVGHLTLQRPRRVNGTGCRCERVGCSMLSVGTGLSTGKRSKCHCPHWRWNPGAVIGTAWCAHGRKLFRR